MSTKRLVTQKENLICLYREKSDNCKKYILESRTFIDLSI